MIGKKSLIIYCLICICLIPSCSNNQLLKLSDCKVISFSDIAILSPTEKGPYPIPDQLVYARIENRDCKGNKDEENLIRQFKAYFSALTIGDIDACKRYTYKDAVAYHKKQFPNLSEQDIWNQYFSNAIMNKVDSLTDLAASKDWEIVPCIPVFFDKISSQNEIYITFGMTIYFDSRTFAIANKQLEKNIAHSSNGGKNWEFMTLNSDSQGILELSCDDEIIKILTKTSELMIK